MKDSTVKLDDSQRSSEESREQCAVSERRVGLMTSEIDELRVGLEQAERCRKQAENDLMEANERANMLHTQNTSFINQKRKIEGELGSVKTEVEEAVTEARAAEDAAKKVFFLLIKIMTLRTSYSGTDNSGLAHRRLKKRTGSISTFGTNEKELRIFTQRFTDATRRC